MNARSTPLALVVVVLLLGVAGCGESSDEGPGSTTTTTPASGTPTIRDEARALVVKYLSADSAADVHELCQTAFTDFYLRSQVGDCADSIRHSAASVEPVKSEFDLHDEDGVMVGSAVVLATIHGGPYDGETLRIVLDNDGTGWLIDESTEQR